MSKRSIDSLKNIRPYFYSLKYNNEKIRLLQETLHQGIVKMLEEQFWEKISRSSLNGLIVEKIEKLHL